MSTISSFRSIENKHGVYRGKDCMTTFFVFFRVCTVKIINFKKKRNEVMNKRAAWIIWKCKSVIFVKKNLKTDIWKIKNIVKLEIIVIIQGNIEALHIAYEI